MAKMTPYKRASASTGTYTDNQGNEKKRWVNVGTLFKYDDGGLSLKIESLPVGGQWNGFISFFDIEDKQGGSRSAGAAPSKAAAMTYDMNDDIPF